jgi:hypothetical protein
MPGEQSVCPSCGEPVEVGALTCPHCGINIQTGESYETQVKRAKGGRGPRGRIARHLGFGVTLAFALVVLGGFIYQQRVVTVMRDAPLKYADYIQRLENVDALTAQGKVADAKREGEALIHELVQMDKSIVIEDAPTTDQLRTEQRPKSIRWAEKRLLQNLIKKAEFALSRLPQQK